MNKVATLIDVIENLSDFDVEDTIYATEPWTAQSKATVLRETESGKPPAEALNAGMMYFLEVDIAKEFIDDWIALSDSRPKSSDICQRIINYAINDA